MASAAVAIRAPAGKLRGDVLEQCIARAVTQRIIDDGNSRQGIVSCLALQFEIRVGERLVPFLQHVNRVAQLLAPVMQLG
jgi:hypothetical protein